MKSEKVREVKSLHEHDAPSVCKKVKNMAREKAKLPLDRRDQIFGARHNALLSDYMDV